jgi:hypothetical protein
MEEQAKHPAIFTDNRFYPFTLQGYAIKATHARFKAVKELNMKSLSSGM